MKLINSINTVGPFLPESLNCRLFMHTTCNFTQIEIVSINLALQAFEVALNGDTTIPAEMYANMLFIDSDSFSFILDDESVLGHCANLIIYPLHRWRRLSLSPLRIQVCILEELAHMFWSIKDEIKVKHKVHEIIRVIWPNVRIEELYDPSSL